MLAAVAMARSSVTVVRNSILLGRYKPRFAAARSERDKMREVTREVLREEQEELAEDIICIFNKKN